jgi:hypothetical protein
MTTAKPYVDPPLVGTVTAGPFTGLNGATLVTATLAGSGLDITGIALTAPSPGYTIGTMVLVQMFPYGSQAAAATGATAVILGTIL